MKKIGELLVTAGLVSQEDVTRSLAVQGKLRIKLGQVLVRLGAISEDSLLPVLAEQIRTPLLDDKLLPDSRAGFEHVLQEFSVTLEWLVANGILIWKSPEGYIVAALDPLDDFLREFVDGLAFAECYSWYLIRSRDFDYIANLFAEIGPQESISDEVAHLRELAEEAPVVELVNSVWAQSIDCGASDIHIEPDEHLFSVRFRIDGILYTKMQLARDRFDAVASRIKLISGLDIAERRLPQDGRLSIRASGAEYDVRVSVMPGVQGESIVLRLLPKERKDFSLDHLGMEVDHIQSFRAWIREPNGIVLVTGPTGSGKSTTLYTALAEANDRKSKIITVEDPVEYKMRGVTQIQTHAEIGYDFSRALRAILRHDPDVIMIGEIRDVETAEIAVQSALTGHMVFSTLHTNDAVSAFGRLIDMGLEPFLVASSLRAVEAQRLVRKVCSACAMEIDTDEFEMAYPEILATYRQLAIDYPSLVTGKPQWLKSVGCQDCQHTGYRGRLGIYEFVPVTPGIRDAIMARQPAATLMEIARKEGYRSLREDGFLKASRAQTTVEEIIRVTGLHDLD